METVKEALTSLGVDAGLVLGIVLFSQGIKYALKLNKNKAHWFILVPMVLGIVAAYIRTSPHLLANIVKDTFAYGGSSAMVYMLGSKLFAAVAPKGK
jgi:uncharacterized membrane protein